MRDQIPALTKLLARSLKVVNRRLVKAAARWKRNDGKELPYLSESEAAELKGQLRAAIASFQETLGVLLDAGDVRQN